MSLKRYNKYKDSGVEWLGEVPEHWDKVKFRYITNLNKGKNPKEFVEIEEYPQALPYLSAEYLRTGTSAKWANLSIFTIIVSEQDILLLWDGANAGEFFRGANGIASSTMAVIKSDSIEDKIFLFYACKSIEQILRKETIGMGIPHVNGSFLKEMFLFIPPLYEQIAIATFLDRETAKIDTLIAEATKAITLLQERRSALISAAVTGKIDVRHLVYKEAS